MKREPCKPVSLNYRNNLTFIVCDVAGLLLLVPVYAKGFSVERVGEMVLAVFVEFDKRVGFM